MQTLLVATSTFPRWAGDTVPARFVFDLSVRLARSYRVVVLAPHAPGAASRESLDGLEVWRFPYFWPRRLEALCNGGGILPALRSGWLPKCQVPSLFMAELYWVVTLLRTRQIDLIHSHWMIPQGLTVALARRVCPAVPHLLTIHSSDVHTLRRLPGGRAASRFILNAADRVITVSSYLRRVLQEVAGAAVDSTVLPMGVDTAIFASRRNKVELRQQYGLTAESVVLYAGKLIEIKGVSTLIRAMAILRHEHDVQLLIAGAGVLRTTLEAEVQALHLTDRVRFLGAVAHARLADLYSLCDAVVVPSIITARRETEGMPVVILEGMAAGRPVVASDVGGISDVVRDGVNGYLVPPQDPQALAGRLRDVLSPVAWPGLSRNAAETAQRYDWDRIGEDYHHIIQSLLDARTRAQPTVMA